VDVGRRQLPPVVGEAPRDPGHPGPLSKDSPVFTGPCQSTWTTETRGGRGEIEAGDRADKTAGSEE
jgi:hypothetical protein